MDCNRHANRLVPRRLPIVARLDNREKAKDESTLDPEDACVVETPMGRNNLVFEDG